MHYENLDVYKLAFRLALDIHQLSNSSSFPKNEQYGGLADQIRRSSKSICANIAEGLTKQGSATEERRFLGIAAGSCEETRVWLDFAGHLGFIEKERVLGLRDDYLNVVKMIHSLMRRREKQ